MRALLLLSSCSVVSDSLQAHGLQHRKPGFPVHHHLPELTQTHVPRVSDAIQPSHPLLSPSLPAFNLPSIRVFSNEWVLCIMWPKYWSFSFSIVLPVNIQGWFPLGLTGLISLLSKGLSRVFSSTTIRSHQFSAQPFFIVQLLQPYMTTGKAMTIWIFVGKMISLLFNTLSRFVIVFVPRSKHLLISWLQSPATVIL